mmetsp:Transcript_43026/g.111288  ORF Transcript_43026/g.111288 Transcript_43026/m.111288 type:complete len:455 (+) Transcript_43026:566-1930(+)
MTRSPSSRSWEFTQTKQEHPRHPSVSTGCISTPKTNAEATSHNRDVWETPRSSACKISIQQNNPVENPTETSSSSFPETGKSACVTATEETIKKDSEWLIGCVILFTTCIRTHRSPLVAWKAVHLYQRWIQIKEADHAVGSEEEEDDERIVNLAMCLSLSHKLCERHDESVQLHDMLEVIDEIVQGYHVIQRSSSAYPPASFHVYQQPLTAMQLRYFSQRTIQREKNFLEQVAWNVSDRCLLNAFETQLESMGFLPSDIVGIVHYFMWDLFLFCLDRELSHRVPIEELIDYLFWSEEGNTWTHRTEDSGTPKKLAISLFGTNDAPQSSDEGKGEVEHQAGNTHAPVFRTTRAEDREYRMEQIHHRMQHLFHLSVPTPCPQSSQPVPVASEVFAFPGFKPVSNDQDADRKERTDQERHEKWERQHEKKRSTKTKRLSRSFLQHAKRRTKRFFMIS